MKNFFKKIQLNRIKKIIPLLIIIILVIFIITLISKNFDLKWQIDYEQTIPDVELVNYLSFSSDNIVSGSVTGFVLFENKEKQPKELKQYVEITASKYSDEVGKQIFYERDIIKMDSIPPRYFDTVPLVVTDSSGSVITLTDTDNNLFFIDKNTKEVRMLDKTGDMSKLLTNNSVYQKFMKEFIK